MKPIAALALALMFWVGCSTTITLQIPDGGGGLAARDSLVLLELDQQDYPNSGLSVSLRNEQQRKRVEHMIVFADSSHFRTVKQPLSWRTTREHTVSTSQIRAIDIHPPAPQSMWVGMGITIGGFTMMGIGVNEEENLYRGVGFFYGGALVSGIGLLITLFRDGSRKDRPIRYRFRY